MHFRVQHRFSGSPGAVVSALCDPSFYVALEIPDLSRPELIQHRTEDNDVVLRLRYEFVGDLDPIVHRLLSHQRLTWIQEVRVDLQAATGTLGYEAEMNPKLLHGEATFALVAEGEETVRRLEGDLVVAVAGIGGMAEHRIVPGILRRLDIEAQALNERLRTPG